MFLVGFRVQKKCNSKFHIFKHFASDWSPHQLEFIYIKQYKRKKLKKIARVTDKHCSKNWYERITRLKL